MKKIYILLLLSCLHLGVQAQEDNYIFNTRNLTVADGLSNNNILSLYQDRNGIMWIGTNYGLNRYDGHEFEWFTNERDGLNRDFINKILEDEEGRLWLVSTVTISTEFQTKSLTIFNPSTEEALIFENAFPNAPFAENLIRDVFQLPDYTLVIHLKDGTYYRYSKENGFSELPFKKTFEWLDSYEQGKIWGSFGSDLVCINLKGDVLQSIPLPAKHEVFKIAKDAKDRIWVVTGQQMRPDFKDLKIQILSGDTLQPILEDVAFEKPAWFRMLHNPVNRSMLIVAQQVILEVDEDLKVNFRRKFYKPYEVNFLSQFLIDRQGTVWNGERNGIQLMNYERAKFKTYLTQEGEMIPTRGIMEYGDALMINSPRGCYWINQKTGEQKKYNEAPLFGSMKAFPVVLTDEEELWVASNVLHRLDSSGNVVQSYSSKSGKTQKIWSFFKSKSGTWWIGMQPQILFFHPDRHDDFQSFTQLNGFDELAKVRVWHFWEDEYGIWMATIKGLYLLDEQKGVIAKYGNTQPERFYLPANQFTYIWRAQKDIYWLATDDGGLIKMTYQGLDKPPIYERKTRASGLPSNELYAIFPDDFGKLWISSSYGIIQMDEKSLEVENIYFEEQGIANNESNKLSYFQSKTGQIYFGGLNGVTSFQPKDFTNLSDYNVPLTFSSIQVFSDNETRNITHNAIENQKINFYPNDQYIVFKVSLQDYFFSDKVKYSYQVKGVDKFPTVVNSNSIQISSLPYGTHELEIRGIGANQQLSTDILTLKIRVVRPFYLQWWFLILVVLVIAASIWQYNSWRMQTLQKRQAYLEKAVLERTQQINKDKTIIETQAEQLREMDEIKSRFFENVSHELRTPLTLIFGPIQSILTRNRLENKDFTLMMLIEQNAKKLLKLINELLDLSSLDADKMKLNNQPIELYAFAKRLVNSFEGAAQLKGISIQLKFELSPNIQVLADEDKLEKILYNYLSNALKFTSKGGQIILRLYQKEEMLYISTEDTGQGIVEEDLEKIFDRFYQAKGDAKQTNQGTGIGLAFCKEMAKLMGGNVWATSKVGEGSTFFVNIPMVETFETATVPTAKDETTARSIAYETAIIPQNIHPKILVVEDNFNLASYMKIVLENYEVTNAENGKVALEKLKMNHYELIITDVMMPEMDGMELLEHLKNNDQYRHIPVIMLTAKQKLEDKVTALRIGVDDYMIKPFEAEELLARVDNLILNNRNKAKANPITHSKKEQLVITEADVKWLEEVEQLILEKVDAPDFTIEELARTFAVGVRRFQQKIKAITGLSPNKYIRQIKLEYARQLLESGNCHSVSEVSYRIGFSDQYYFTKLYSKRYGRTPSSYF